MADNEAPVTAVLFDMDGVIVDSERYWQTQLGHGSLAGRCRG